ncbi:hypothetical protein C2S52_009110 [Perilla frutescens var. hirtella]|uniref:S-protein homolog n=1 Tax=Perilla frutescens var. hirtella TaxID=608512 RepID=A0AAD4PGM3_PERFH|nr:hypothetical protein C2S51_017365 [Perilla frutescens var. frutescens]KAH6784151.1 hypothetical protein C2S52_009110 [Perilla frutescens var. hirtella]KAH6838242.1 hypothetical protein C2S53_017867 [Perilla frutescens var. hirtella]
MKLTMAKAILFVFIIANLFQPFAQGCGGFEIEKYKMVVVNSLPKNSSPLKLHCASGDDDLGYHNLTVGQTFHWSFCQSFLDNTLYFCHFWWGKKQVAFDVFNPHLKSATHVSVWAARTDGIYHSEEYLVSSQKKYKAW